MKHYRKTCHSADGLQQEMWRIVSVGQAEGLADEAIAQLCGEATRRAVSGKIAAETGLSRYQQVCEALMLQGDLSIAAPVDREARRIRRDTSWDRMSDGKQNPITVTRDGQTFEVPADYFQPERETTKVVKLETSRTQDMDKLAAFGNASEAD